MISSSYVNGLELRIKELEALVVAPNAILANRIAELERELSNAIIANTKLTQEKELLVSNLEWCLKSAKNEYTWEQQDINTIEYLLNKLIIK
ncbi:MAG: hypothetical protein CMC55_08750 [Flavobacteriaceae bacterium]|nr:hypothetical protein [Flavobacteriaceae bacterium]|tara:strand:+ start:1192 stop:1467 length:276 start_codon:yes stop_codon:yes gene_type:complete